LMPFTMAYGGAEVYLHAFFNLYSRQRWVGEFHIPAALLQLKILRSAVASRPLLAYRPYSEQVAKETSLRLSEIEHRSVACHCSLLIVRFQRGPTMVSSR